MTTPLGSVPRVEEVAAVTANATTVATTTSGMRRRETPAAKGAAMRVPLAAAPMWQGPDALLSPAAMNINVEAVLSVLT